MKCVILQPSYIPWRGYFHQMQKADVFVFYDDVQYDRRGWRNRNRVKTPQGSRWLTIPVNARGAQQQDTPINEISVDQSQNWAAEHLKTLQHLYARAPYFYLYLDLLESHYANPPVLLADFTIDLTIALAATLGIQSTRFMRSSSLTSSGSKSERLISILRTLGADHYISGPLARDYIETDKFHSAGIEIEYMVYGYPPYEQLYPPFDPQVTILDLLFMQGEDAGRYIWGVS